MALPFGYAEFDLVCCHRVLHHVRRPELAVSELGAGRAAGRQGVHRGSARLDRPAR